MFKKFLIFSAVLLLSISTFAQQNARVQSMGGCDIQDDITGLIGNPADMNDYPDQVQATAYSGTSFGPAIGIKSIGDKINVGILALPIGASGSSMLGGDFYATGRARLGDLDSVGNIPGAFPTIPHLLFGMDFGNVTIGLDFFFEFTKYKVAIDSMVGTQSYKEDINKSISNIGGVLSSNISLGKLSLSPLVGIGFPRAKGTAEIVTDTTIVDEVETEKGLFFTAGTEVGFDINKLTLILGGFFTSEPYQFKYNTTTTDEFADNFFSGYAGFITKLSNDMFLITHYFFENHIDKSIDDNDSTGIDTRGSYTEQGLHVGMEKPIEGIWIFDKITPRAGFVYSVNGAKMKTESSGGPTNEVSVNTANTASEVQLTTGLGVSKGIAAIDLAVVLGSWNGVLTGPSVITGTLTLDFGKRGSSSSAVGSYESTPSPVFSNEESTPVPEEPASDDTETESDSSTDFDF